MHARRVLAGDAVHARRREQRIAAVVVDAARTGGVRGARVHRVSDAPRIDEARLEGAQDALLLS